jgi:hypothetical protein
MFCLMQHGSRRPAPRRPPRAPKPRRTFTARNHPEARTPAREPGSPARPAARPKLPKRMSHPQRQIEHIPATPRRKIARRAAGSLMAMRWEKRPSKPPETPPPRENHPSSLQSSNDDGGHGSYSQLSFSPSSIPTQAHPYPPSPTVTAGIPLDGRYLSGTLTAGRYFVAVAKYPVSLGPGIFNVRSSAPSPALQNSRLTALWGGVSANEAWKGQQFLAGASIPSVGGEYTTSGLSPINTYQRCPRIG